MYRKFFKRLFDVVFSILSLILLFFLIVFVGILIKAKLGSPVIFKQKRPGKDEKIFTLYKFRTMIDKYDKKGNLLPDGERLTKFGKFLRASSLDELPELWNILKGDMSFVGPRPLLVEYLPLYNDVQKQRHNIKPGLTGLAQINGRNSIKWEDKFKYDVDYVETICFINDIKIICLTAFRVVKRSGITSKKSATMERFNGDIKEDYQNA